MFGVRGSKGVLRPTRRTAVLGVSVLGAALVMSACSGGHRVATRTGTGASSAQGSTVGATTPANAIVVIRDLPGHPHALTTAAGFALYAYSSDPAGRSVCTGTCLTFWPPLVLPSGMTTPVGGPGVTGLGTFSGPDGVQVTFGGHPLYTFQQDTKAGEVTGQGAVVSGGTFDVAVVSAAAAAAASTTSTASSSPVTNSSGAVISPSSTPSSTNGTTSPSVKTTMVTAPSSTSHTTTSSPSSTSPSTSPPSTTPPSTSPPTTAPPSTSPPTTAPPTTSPPTTAPPTTLPVY